MATRFTLPAFVLLSLSLLLSSAPLLPAQGAAQETGRAGEGEEAQLPVSRVVLFTSGVAYLEHLGVITGDATWSMPVPRQEMDDLLKSLIVRDFGGGSVGAVTYRTEDPLLRRLQQLSVDLSDAPSFASLLRRLRGAELEIRSDTGSFTGRLLSVEEREGSEDEESRLYINLAQEGEVRSFGVAGMTEIAFLDPRLRREVEEALSIIDDARNDTTREVTFSFSGEGERETRVAYLREAPLWKLTYRLAVDEPGEATLQGWAIVENTGTQEWSEVELTLVSGAPRSFIMDLYQPRYIRRPRLTAEQADREVRARASEPAPQAARSAQAFGEIAESAMDIDSGVVPVAEGAERGAFVEYRVATPVTLQAGAASMIPVIQERIPTTRLSLYSPGDGEHPLEAVEVQNETGLTLQGGAVTIFDQGGYGGDSILGTMPPGERQTVGFARDLRTEVREIRNVEPEEVTEVTIRGSYLLVTRRARRSVAYEVRTSHDSGRTVRIEHPRERNWDLASPRPTRTEASAYLFDIEAAAGRPETITIAEERLISQSVALNSLAPDRIAYYLQQGEALSSELRDGLSRMGELQERISTLQRERQLLQGEIDSLYREQERIRENLAVLDSETSLYRTYLSRLETQEERLSELSRRQEELRQEIARRQGELERLIGELSKS